MTVETCETRSRRRGEWLIDEFEYERAEFLEPARNERIRVRDQLVAGIEAEIETISRRPGPVAVVDHLEAEIARSKALLRLESGWDDDDAPGYDKATWKASATFLRSFAKWLWKTHGTRMAVPRIRPGPDGSIDIRWKAGTRELLLNIPVDERAPLTFYGDDAQRVNCVRGQFEREDFAQGPLAWLVRAP